MYTTHQMFEPYINNRRWYILIHVIMHTLNWKLLCVINGMSIIISPKFENFVDIMLLVLTENGEKCERKWFWDIQNGRRQNFCEQNKKKVKVAHWSEMARNGDQNLFSVIQNGGGGAASQWPTCKPLGVIYSICPWANTPILVFLNYFTFLCFALVWWLQMPDYQSCNTVSAMCYAMCTSIIMIPDSWSHIYIHATLNIPVNQHTSLCPRPLDNSVYGCGTNTCVSWS